MGDSLGGWRLMEFDLFGRRIVVERAPSGWAVFHPYEEGKRREAGIRIPPDILEADIAQYLADLYHEDASPAHPNVRRIQ